MSTSAVSSEATQEVLQIQAEINKRKIEQARILNRQVNVTVLPRAYFPETFCYKETVVRITLSQLYGMVQRTMQELEETIKIQHASLAARPLEGVRIISSEELRLASIEDANAKSEHYQLAKKAVDFSSIANGQLATIDGLFHTLADSLQLLSISVVGIVARYAV